jgi:hypothetical protein
MPWTKDDADSHKKGLSDKGKTQWARIANSVLKRCMAKGGSEKECAASAIKQANGSVNANVSTSKYAVYKNKQSDYEPRLTVHQEKAHIVVPVVMMVEGVHHGSDGPLLHSMNELGKYPDSWNGIPVVIYHPMKDDQPVSANSPDIIDTRMVGRVYNTNVDDKKLKAEVWLDEDKLNSISPDTLEAVNNSKTMEVSIGVFTDKDDTVGVYEGEEYKGIACNHRPDHLAILPDMIGACSCEDGCGLGVNDSKDEVIETIQRLNKEGFAFTRIGNYGEVGYNEKMSAVYTALRGLDDEKKYHYLEEMYESYLVYNQSSPDGTKMYKRDYKFESGKIEFNGDPVEVHKKVEYVNTNVKQKKEVKMAQECSPCIKKKVDDLIANSQGKYTEDDRGMLETLSEAILDKIATPVTIEKEKIVEKEVQVNALSDEDKSALAAYKKQLKDRRDQMIAEIQTNAKDIWPVEKLNGMDDDTLERVLNSVGKKVGDYSLNGSAYRKPAPSGPKPLKIPVFEQAKK